MDGVVASLTFKGWRPLAFRCRALNGAGLGTRQHAHPRTWALSSLHVHP